MRNLWRQFFRRGDLNRTAILCSLGFLIVIQVITASPSDNDSTLRPSGYLPAIVTGACVYALRQWERFRLITNVVVSLVALMQTIGSTYEVVRRGLNHADISGPTVTIVIFVPVCFELIQLLIEQQP